MVWRKFKKICGRLAVQAGHWWPISVSILDRAYNNALFLESHEKCQFLALINFWRLFKVWWNWHQPTCSTLRSSPHHLNITRLDEITGKREFSERKKPSCSWKVKLEKFQENSRSWEVLSWKVTLIDTIILRTLEPFDS